MPCHQHTYLPSGCTVCGAFRGSLTTDCPGVKVNYARQQEVCTTHLDYTDKRGWHQSTKPRGPRFATGVWSGAHVAVYVATAEPDPIDPPTRIVPSIVAALADAAPLQLELTLKAVAWVCADRLADDLSATLTSLEEELGAVSKTREYAKIAFQRASQHADKCDDEFRQAARQLVSALEQHPTRQEM